MSVSKSAWLVVALAAGLLVGRGSLGCGAPALPPGPAPEYERPKLEPWDAAPPPDPFDIPEGQVDWVDDEAPEESDAGLGDAGTDQDGAGAGDAGASADAGDGDAAVDGKQPPVGDSGGETKSPRKKSSETAPKASSSGPTK
jgi:hypothetical protein